ncbi:MAG TPA: hypothetical protein VID48_06875 [Solirubrobacteraceae bacterium]
MSVELTAAQARVLAEWAVEGDGFVPLRLDDRPPMFAHGWVDGDVLVTQGDAHLHIDKAGCVKDMVP